MADDTMEISSEHGHNMEQGDIDIDLDLTSGNVDDDYILEDTTSHIDFGNDFNPQTSLALNDDIMLDDDAESYQMEDADLLDEGGVHIMEQESMSFAITDEDGIYFSTDPQGATQPVAADEVNQSISASYQDPLAPSNVSLEHSPQQVVSEDVLEYDNTQYTQEIQPEGSESVEETMHGKESHLSTPSHHSVTPATLAEPRSPPISLPENHATSPTAAFDQTDPNSTINSPQADHSTNYLPLAADDHSAGYNVRVVYREVVYDLFSSSESDDPDSFFLSDLSMAKKPLEEFFKAIRNVIHEDLVDEDELCIVVESLGLQTEEVSSLMTDVTLEQILTLHARLLNNDGAEPSAEPCFMLLRTRPNFATRFSNLIAGAAEGKGLSEYLSWDEQSTGLEDSEDVDESKHDIETILDHEAVGEVVEEIDRQQKEGATESKDLRQDDELQEHDGAQSQDHELKIEIAQEFATPVPTDSGRDIEASGGVTSSTLKEKAVTGSDVDEDGDLIDYSDDEAEDSGNQKPASRETDEDRTTNEYEEADKNLRRQSLSRAAIEDKSGGIPISPQVIPVDGNEQEGYPDANGLEYDEYNDNGETEEYAEEKGDEHEELLNGGEKGEYPEELGYDQPNEEGHEYKDENPEYGESTAVDVTESQNEIHGHDFVSKIQEGDEEYVDHVSGQINAAEQGANDESAIANFENDELDFGIGETVSFEDLNSDREEDSLRHIESSEVYSSQAKSKANSLATIETTTSSVTMVADEIQYEEDIPEEVANGQQEAVDPNIPKEGVVSGTAEEYKDEIDYEDDEDVEKPQYLTDSNDSHPEAKGFSNANGKRSIADVESSDPSTSQTQDAKRPRS